MYDYGMHGYGIGFSWLFLLLLIILVFYFMRGDKSKDESARDILDKRYAKGEIDEQEYRTKIENLEK